MYRFLGRRVVDNSENNGVLDVPHPGLLIGKRRQSGSQEITYPDLKAAYVQAAKVVAEYGDTYLPIFERLEKELKEAEKKQSAIDRALKIAKENL